MTSGTRIALSVAVVAAVIGAVISAANGGQWVGAISGAIVCCAVLIGSWRRRRPGGEGDR